MKYKLILVALIASLGAVAVLDRQAEAQLQCANFNGVWRRSDGFTIRFTQRGCALSGVQIDSSPYNHTMTGSVSGRHADLVVTRIDPQGCRTNLYYTLDLRPDQANLDGRVTHTDGGCGLSRDYREAYPYWRVR